MKLKVIGLLLKWLLRDVTRIEVIGPKGRNFSNWNIKLEHSIQDKGLTLKLFWEHRARS